MCVFSALQQHLVPSWARCLLKRVANAQPAPSAPPRVRLLKINASNVSLGLAVHFQDRQSNSRTVCRFVCPALGRPLALLRALLAQLGLTIRAQAPPASLSASPALQDITRLLLDKVHALLAPLELGAVLSLPNQPLIANHAVKGRTILQRDHLV